MKSKLALALACLGLTGCPDAHFADRVRNARDAAGYAAAMERCLDEAEKSRDAGVSTIVIEREYEKCGAKADAAFGRKP